MICHPGTRDPQPLPPRPTIMLNRCRSSRRQDLLRQKAVYAEPAQRSIELGSDVRHREVLSRLPVREVPQVDGAARGPVDVARAILDRVGMTDP